MTRVPAGALQASLFEENYLLRELGQLAHVPQIALTELVANSWDAGATRVNVEIPTAIGNVLTVEDDGHGMTEAEFKIRWMTLGYNRLKRQSADVEFPPGQKLRPRRAFGRNGEGRHGLLCFADEYTVETTRNGTCSTFVVGTSEGRSPFVLKSASTSRRGGHGTKLVVRVKRKLPDPTEMLNVLSARFVHDPEFRILVNGRSQSFSELEGKVSESRVQLSEGRWATVHVIDTTRLNQAAYHQGIAFWVQQRLVGNPSWAVGSVVSFDGRTRFAKRYNIIVSTEGFESEVLPDWSGFRASKSINELHRAVADRVAAVANELVQEVVDESAADALTQNRGELETLGYGAKVEVAQFTKAVAQAHPTISPDFLATAVRAVIHLEKSKSGAALLQRLSALSPDDIDGLNQLLTEWTVKDALRVLDEIDDRLRVLEAIRRLADDPSADELHTLHPLVLRSRWLFGAEFESDEYRSNSTLQTVSRELFNKPDARFINERNRPDIVVLADRSTLQLTGIESFDPADPTAVRVDRVLLIELKRGKFKISRDEMNQADGYIQDIAGSGLVSGHFYINAWVVGQTVAPGVGTDKQFQDLSQRQYARLRATTFATLVDTANWRLMRLRDKLSERYSEQATDKLVERALSEPSQARLSLEAAASPPAIPAAGS